MNELENISHVYKGLLLRNRAFASFRNDELECINLDINKYINPEDWILDPMSGYGGGMLYFGSKGHKTYNIEINPPAYYWQVLNNPRNRGDVLKSIDLMISNKNKLPKLTDKFSISDDLFQNIAVLHIKRLLQFILDFTIVHEISISILLPFVARFANYQRSSTNITHFIQGGFCSFEGWENDFEEYLNSIKKLLNKSNVFEIEHFNILSNIFEIEIARGKFKFFVTSPPYPNYRDYSKIFKIENWILDNVIFNAKTNFNEMIGSNTVSGKKCGEIHSPTANKFLSELLDKSKKLSRKSKRDIEVYYHPYFSLYFFNIQEAYKKLDTMLTDEAIGYLVVNDNITRDIQVPVGKTVCDIFLNMGYQTENLDESQITHYGNIGKSAKRINSHHTRHILKVWKK